MDKFEAYRRSDIFQKNIDLEYVCAGIAYDAFSEFVVYRDNGLFSRRSFGGELDFFGSVDVLAKSCIVHFENFLVWKGWEGFLDLEGISDI